MLYASSPLFLSFFAALLLILNVSPSPAHAAETITGHVTDEAGQPVAGAEIVISELRRETTSDADGSFQFADVPQGDYTLVIRRAGYAPVVRDLLLTQAADVAVTLRVTPFEIEPTDVTATRTPIDPLQSPLPASALGAEDTRREHSVSLAHVVDRLPGVRTVSTGQEIGKPMIRGLVGARVLVLDNGSRMEDYSWSDEDGPSIDPEQAERVEVIRGPASVLYGSDAIGGVVNAIPYELPEAEERPSLFRAGLEGYGATNNHEFGGTLRLEGASKDIGWRILTTGRKSEALHTPDGELENTGFFALNGTGAVGIHGTRGNATLRVTRYGGEFHLLEANGPPPGVMEGTEEGPVRKADDERVQFTSNLLGGRSFRFETKAQWQRHSLIEVSDEAMKLVETPAVRTTAAQAESAAFDLLLNTLSLDLLGHHTVGEMLRGTLGVSGLHQVNDTRGPIPLVPDATVTNGAVFLFEQLRTPHVNLLGGARVDAHKIEAKENEDLALADTTIDETRATGDVGIVVQPVPELSLAANVGRAWRAPTLFELFTNGPNFAEARYDIGRVDLESETSLNLDGSIRWQHRRIRGEVSAFHNKIDNFIFVARTSEFREIGADTLRVFRYMQTDAVLNGAEALVEVEPVSPLILRARFDMVRGKEDSSGANLPMMPPPRGTFEVEVRPTNLGWAESAYFGAELEVVGEQTHLSPLDSPEGHNPYTLVNIDGGIVRMVGGRPLRVDVRVLNVGDRPYKDFLSRYKEFALNPGRNIVLRVGIGL
jgi:outer membrane receptor protein involved in Fe transport